MQPARPMDYSTRSYWRIQQSASRSSAPGVTRDESCRRQQTSRTINMWYVGVVMKELLVCINALCAAHCCWGHTSRSTCGLVGWPAVASVDPKCPCSEAMLRVAPQRFIITSSMGTRGQVPRGSFSSTGCIHQRLHLS